LAHNKLWYNYGLILLVEQEIHVPRIIPIKDLKDTGRISAMVHESHEPIFVTKNGYGDIVIMSMESYEQSLRLHDLLALLDEAEHDFEQGKTDDAFASLEKTQEKYGL
jgi:PHD/YefM family antitoxin component YafN of YafNO toxin-antitoxin module